MSHRPEEPGNGPAADDLAEIEREWPLIEAELALVDAEIRVLTATGAPSPLDWRRLRRAEQRVMRELLIQLATVPSAAMAAPHAPSVAPAA